MSLVIRMFGSDAQLFVWIGLFIGLLVYDELFMRLDNAMDWHIITKHTYPIYKHLKLGAIQKFLEMDVTWHQKHNSGTLVGKVADGVEKVRDILDGLSWEFVPTFIQIILSFIPLLLFSPPTAGIALIAFLAFGWLSIKSNKQKQVYRSKRHDLYEEEWHRSIEAVQGHETLLMFGQTNHVLSGLEELHDKVISLGQKEAYVGIFKYNRYRIRILTLARRAILAILVWQLYSGSLDIAGIIFINVLTEKLINSFWRFARLLDRASEASEGAKRLADLMVEKAHYIESDNTAVCIPSHQIEMENVCFGYGGNYSEEDGALHKFSLTIDAGKITAIVGPSGAGKTTIRKLITGEIPIISGKIKLGGVDIRHLDKKALLSQFSYVPQGDDVVIFAGSVKENIAFPRPSASMDEIIHAAKLAGIHETIMEMTNKYEEKVGERGKRLSGGQKQRIALARAILAERPILILDEATSAVDTLTERVIQTNMQDILQGKTAIVIAHRLSTIKNANKIVVMDQGCKIEEGSHEELIRKEGLYAQMVASQDLS